MTSAETVLITSKTLLTLTLQPLRDRLFSRLPIDQRSVDDTTSFRLNQQSIVNQSPISRRLVGDHLATTKTSSRPKSVAARLLCMFKRQLANYSSWRYSAAGWQLVGDWSPTSAKPFCDLCNLSTILTFLNREAVVERLQRQCEQGFTHSVVSDRFNGEGK